MWMTLRVCSVLVMVLISLAGGCGTTKLTKATDQLLLSDAVERAVTSMDFRLLANQRVFLDTQYVETVKGLSFINADYITSALRHQMMACGCRLEQSAKEADYIVEVRLGALGTDDHTLTVGIPESRNLSNAASLVSSGPAMPVLPEIALVRRNDRHGAAKLVAFAYHRKSRRPVWQSDVALARSTAQDTWLFGAGPIQRGTIYKGVRFAGNKLKIPSIIPSMGAPRKALEPEQEANKKTFMVTDEPPVGRPDKAVQKATVVTPVEEEK